MSETDVFLKSGDIILQTVQRNTFETFFFQKMDRNKDGVVTIEEFIESCKKVIFVIYLNISLCFVQEGKSLQLTVHLKRIIICLSSLG